MLDDVLITLPDLSLDPTEETLRCTPKREGMLSVIVSHLISVISATD